MKGYIPKILVCLLILFLVDLLVYPVMILFDSTQTSHASLTLQKKGMPKEEYRYMYIIPGSNDPIITDIAIDPSNSNTIYVSSSNFGILKSIDGGITWRESSNGLPTASFDRQHINIQKLAFSPYDSSQLIAKTGELDVDSYYTSNDGGVTWNSNQQISLPESQKSLLVVNEGQAITPDPNNSAIVYKVQSTTVLRSSDRGLTWEPIFGSRAKRLFSHPLVNTILTPAIITYMLLAWFTPSGAFLNYTGIDFDGYFTTPLVFPPNNPDIFYIGTSQGVIKGKILKD